MEQSITIPTITTTTKTKAKKSLVERHAFFRMLYNFVPSWFLITMGTGAMAVAMNENCLQFNGLYYISLIFYALAFVLFGIFMLFTVLRFILFPETFKLLLKHPAQSLFLGAIPISWSMIVILTAVIIVRAANHWAYRLTFAMYSLNLLMAVLSTFGIPFLMINTHELKIEKMNALWFLPIIPMLAVSSAGAEFAEVLEQEHALVVLLISYCTWGIGMGLIFLLMALYLYRLMLFKLPDKEVIVSSFIPLGPMGAGAFSIMWIGRVGKEVFSKAKLLELENSGEIIFAISQIVGLIIWGFGLWWLAHGITFVLVRFKKYGIEFNMGYWGFIFPCSVYTIGTIALGYNLPSQFFKILASIFLICVFILWLILAFATIRRVISGSIFRAPDTVPIARTNV